MQSETQRILVVDDDPGIREVLCECLSQHGYETAGAASAAEMDRALAARPPDLIVLDLMMPGGGGLSVCRRIAGKGPPVVMLSAMGEDTDRIIGLELGADDYLAKPCNPRGLLARVRAVLRRPREEAAAEGPALLFAGWRLDLLRRELTRPDGGLVGLSAGEFAPLRALAGRRRRRVRQGHGRADQPAQEEAGRRVGAGDDPDPARRRLHVRRQGRAPPEPGVRRPSSLPVVVQVGALAALAVVMSQAVAFAVVVLAPEPRPGGVR